MTELEIAYNQGVDECARVVALAASQIPPQHAVTVSGIKTLADDLRGLKLGVPVPDVPK